MSSLPDGVTVRPATRADAEAAAAVMRADEEPSLPVGLAIETFHEEEARAFHAATIEAFEEEWGFERTPFDEWWEMRSRADDFDPSLWFLVRDGGEIAAVARCEANRREGGFV